MKEGIDAVIVDSVLAIRKGLTAHEETERASRESKDTVAAAAAAAAAQLTNGNTPNGASTNGAAAANGTTPAANGASGSNEARDDVPPEIARIVDTVNGVPVYSADGNGNAVNGAVF